MTKDEKTLLFRVKELNGSQVTLHAPIPQGLDRCPRTIADSHDQFKVDNQGQLIRDPRKMTWLRRWMGNEATRRADGGVIILAQSSAPPESGIGLNRGSDIQSEWQFLLDGFLIIGFPKDAAYQAGNYWLIEVTCYRGQVRVAGSDSEVQVPVRGMRHRAPICSGGKPFNLRKVQEGKPSPDQHLDFQPGDLAASRRRQPAAAPEPAEKPRSLLSDAGVTALKQYIRTPQEILRRIPARYLNAEVTLPSLVSWLAPALVSEIADLSFEEFAEEFQFARPVPQEDWPQFEREAQGVLTKASEFSRMMASNAGIQSLLR